MSLHRQVRMWEGGEYPFIDTGEDGRRREEDDPLQPREDRGRKGREGNVPLQARERMGEGGGFPFIGTGEDGGGREILL